MSRRIDRLEASLGVVLFDRRRTGYLLTEAGQALIPHADKMESALLEAVEESAGLGVRVKGSVRLGTPEGLGMHLIAPGLMKLHREHPGLHVQLMAQSQFPSLVTREVEILITLDPPEVGRYKFARLTDVHYSLYCSPGYRDSHPPIRQLSDVAEHSFVDYIHDDSLSGHFRVLEELTPHPKRSFTSTSLLAARGRSGRHGSRRVVAFRRRTVRRPGLRVPRTDPCNPDPMDRCAGRPAADQTHPRRVGLCSRADRGASGALPRNG